ncbi:MAG: NAD(P)-binding domain-containing protein [Acetobacteraceae bacterium]|nr:NAD(P)-binding domain-containing protein [Acetobacteraceae bacterium]
MDGASERPACLVAGGGRREAEAAAHLVRLGLEVRGFGLPVPAGWREIAPAGTLEEGARGAVLLLLPVAGVGEQGELPVQPALVDHAGPPRLSPAALEALSPGAVVAVGGASAWLRRECGRLKLRLEEYRERDDFATLNAVPTAEGAIRVAIGELPVTVQGCCALVLGFGRCGRALSRRLLALGARTLVAARRPEDRCRAWEEGHQPVPFDRLAQMAGQADVIFNTVPAPVLGADILERTAPEVVILDIASAPGGTDFDAARALGRRALLLPGIPGQAATRTSGRILAETAARLLWPTRSTPLFEGG